MIQNYTDLTRLEMERVDKERTIVMLPLGATEQHGSQAPLGTDMMIAGAMPRYIKSAMDPVDPDFPMLIFPAIPVGLSVEHMDFCGSVTLKPDTYYKFLYEIVESIAHHGFRKFVFLVCHGGNRPIVDALARQLYEESVSLDELQTLSKNKERLSTAIPAFWPIDRSLLRTGIGSFGWRIHPLYHSRKFHKGIDLAGNVGDPIYATGDATVESIDTRNSTRGYGRQILLNHEFGYKTRYAHLNRILVKPGDKIVRGQLIGELGRSGGVTGPHLHYEVIHQGSVVNPINYFNKNMSPEEYEHLMSELRELNLEKDE